MSFLRKMMNFLEKKKKPTNEVTTIIGGDEDYEKITVIADVDINFGFPKVPLNLKYTSVKRVLISAIEVNGNSVNKILLNADFPYDDLRKYGAGDNILEIGQVFYEKERFIQALSKEAEKHDSKTIKDLLIGKKIDLYGVSYNIYSIKEVENKLIIEGGMNIL
jgi:hypothetical protein